MNVQHWVTPYLYYNTTGFALITVLLSGFMLGSHKGFSLGIAWGIANILEIYPMKGVAWSAPSLYIICAPIVGYLGGTEIFEKKHFFRNGVLLLLIFHLLMIFGNVIFGNVGQAPMTALAFLQNSIALFIVRHTILRLVKRPNIFSGQPILVGAEGQHIESRLRSLDELRNKGLITNVEHQEQRNRILNDL